MQLNEIISLRLLDPTMTDWGMKDCLLTLPPDLKEVVVFPVNLQRTKQLLARSATKIGVVIDYPLGAGTLAKKAFEAGRAFQTGADFLELSITPSMLIEQPEFLLELRQTLGSMAATWGEIRISIATTGLRELTKIAIAEKLKELGWQKIILGEGNSLEEALHDAMIFQYDGGQQLKVQINLKTTTIEEIHDLILQGADYFGVQDLAGLELAQQLEQDF